MAETAQGKACPNCGTLTACSGNFDDEMLGGTCSTCGTHVEMPHIVYQKDPLYGGRFVHIKKNAEEKVGPVPIGGSKAAEVEQVPVRGTVFDTTRPTPGESVMEGQLNAQHELAHGDATSAPPHMETNTGLRGEPPVRDPNAPTPFQAESTG